MSNEPASEPTARHAGQATISRATATIANARLASTTASNATPGCGAATCAGPIGIHREATTAIATAVTAPTIALARTGMTTTTNRWRPVRPRLRHVSASSEAMTTWRTSNWPTANTPTMAASTAKSASATASGRMACSTFCACSPSSATNTPEVAGNLPASACAASVNAVRSVPGARRTSAPSNALYCDHCASP